MKIFISELQYVSELYDRLRCELSPGADQAHDTDCTTLTRAVLRNRELWSRVEQMDARLAQLSKDWQYLRQHLSPQSMTSIRALAAAVRNKAAELSLLMDKRTKELAEGRRKLEKALNEVHKGGRYLASVKPVKANYPKFVDSLG
jgi:hypothetical protein